MIYRLGEIIQNQLLRMPETGMGYQIAEVAIAGKYINEKLIVLNAEIGMPLDYENSLMYDYSALTYKQALDKSVFTSMVLVKTFSRKDWHMMLRESRFDNKKPAKDNDKEKADGKEKFARLSAYEDDKRVDKANKRFLPGTYATTDDDYHSCVNTNDDPVERYALPNDEKIKYAFYVRPKEGDILQRGTVEPAFGRRGGGKEIYFDNGTSNNTYLGMVLYGNFM